MATSAVIIIEGFNAACVYKHHDGYPEGTLPWLEEFNKDFTEKRGNDTEYKFAQLLRSSERDAEKYRMCTDKHTGWGVCAGLCEGSYTYTLKADGTVTVAS